MSLTVYKRLLCIVLALLMCGCMVLSVYADPSDIDATYQTIENSAYLVDICTQANNSIGKEILSYDSSTGLLRFSNKLYKDLDTDDKEEFMETALSAVRKSGMYASNKQGVYNFIASQDTAISGAMKYLQSDAGADLAEAKKYFAPFSGVIGTILGLLSLLTFMFLGLSITFDVFYLVLPFFQGIVDKEDGRKPFGVSNEAWKAKEDAAVSTEYKNSLSLYFRRRLGVIVAVAIAIGYLISGKLYDIVVYLIDAFS